MSKEFDKCLKSKGSKIKTESMSKGRFQRICINKDGKLFSGEIQTKKKK